jgi:sporulation protein YlmC with PRC-barrel domain
MLARHLAMALFGTALASAPALAQTQAPSSTTSPPAVNQPSTTGAPAPNMNFMTQEQPGQWRASKLEGLDVYNNNNEKIGDIGELIVDSNGQVQAVVIGVGGFLGLGEHDVAVPFREIKLVIEPRASAAASNTAPPASPASPGTTAPSTTGSTTSTTADMNRSTPDHAMLNMTKDQLTAAPEFKYSR